MPTTAIVTAARRPWQPPALRRIAVADAEGGALPQNAEGTFGTGS